jgi:hypothetical protein
MVLVPGVLALLPEYAGLDDPVAELRSACRAAVEWLAEAGPVTIVGDPQGRNGSACRTEKAPGYLDERAIGFDADLARALTAPDPAALAAIDPVKSTELLAATDGIRALGDVLSPAHVATVDYDDDPYGVQYWVVRWNSRLP